MAQAPAATAMRTTRDSFEVGVSRKAPCAPAAAAVVGSDDWLTAIGNFNSAGYIDSMAKIRSAEFILITFIDLRVSTIKEVKATFTAN